MTNPSIDPLVGRTVAQYEILAKLGGGGMGVVYKARDTRLGRIVALKFLPQQWSHDEEAKQRFVREAQAASATDHRNICTIHDIATADDGQLFIVMAYYEGATLKQRLDAGALPIDEALDIATQVAEGLARAHAQGVVHRDIKPGNLILAEDGVRIVDFGLATFADALQLTVAGSTLGTAPYMSPEQVRGEAVDARTDVWATGAILYQMLAGHVPFQGAYAEAIAYAIRHETPAPLRALRPEVPEEVEQVVFRALHKDPAVRFASGRELARALRQVSGQSVPLDLRTEPVIVSPAPMARRQARRRPMLIAAGLAVLAALTGAGWMLRSVERTPVVVVPVANVTGSGQLDSYLRALTLAVIHELSDSPTVRPVSWPRTRETLRGYIASGADIAGREVVQALAGAGGARMLVLPTLLYEDQKWRVRVEVRDGQSDTNVATYDSPPVASALPKETAYDLAIEAARIVEQHFDNRWWRRFAPARPPARMRTPDAAKAFEEGLSAYEDQEYAAAYASFQQAAGLDPQNPLPPAWSSRSARVMRHDGDATASANAALSRLNSNTPETVRLLVEAIADDADPGIATATAKHEELIRRQPDEPLWVTELAALQERNAGARDSWEQAVNTYLQVLAADSAQIRPRLELCRLYVNLQEFPRARAEGRQALAAFTRTGSRNGETFARFCLVDALRAGTDEDRAEALKHADAALQAMRESGSPYNLSRALYYRGLVAAEQRRLAEALSFWGPAVAAAETSGNVVLQARLFNVLGVAHHRLGNGAEAAGYYQRSADIYGRLGDQRGAARQQLNSASLRIAFGVGASQAVSDVQNALAVVRDRGDPDFEVTCLEAIAAHYRHTTRYADADRQLTEALSVAGRFDLALKRASVRLQMARLHFDRADYTAAHGIITELILTGSANSATQSWLLLARVQTRLGDFAGARQSLANVEKDLDRLGDDGVRLAFYEAAGELAFEADDLAAARTWFRKSAAAPLDEFLDQAVVDSRAYLGLIDAQEGRTASARELIDDSVARARRMGRLALEARYRVFLSRAYLRDGRRAEALDALQAIPQEVVDSLGTELRAQVHYWSSQSAATPEEGAPRLAAARQLIDTLQASMPEADRRTFTARREVSRILG